MNEEVLPIPNPNPPAEIDWSSILKHGNKDWFGHKDYFAARKQGVSNLQIKEYLDRIGMGTQGGVRMGNVKGGNIGGVYNIVDQLSGLDTQTNTYRDQVADLEGRLADKEQFNQSLLRDTTTVSQGAAVQPRNKMAIGPSGVGPVMDAGSFARREPPRSAAGGMSIGGTKKNTKKQSLVQGMNIGNY